MTTLIEYWASYKAWLQSTWGDHILDRWINSAMVLVHLGFGLVLVYDDPLSFSADTYDPLRTISQGNFWLWGVVILFSGLLMATPYKWVNVVGLWIGMAWMVVWTALFLLALFHSQEASAIPAVACGGFALINTALLTSRVINSEPFGW